MGGVIPAVAGGPLDQENGWVQLGGAVDPDDCEGPAGDPEPGAVEWVTRDAANLFCAHQRRMDRAQHPALADEVLAFAQDFDTAMAFDPYRVPTRHGGVRFRFDEVSVTNREGAVIEVELYRPCAEGTCNSMPDVLQPHEPPTPSSW